MGLLDLDAAVRAPHSIYWRKLPAAEVPGWLALAVAFLIGSAYATWLLGADFFSPNSQFWKLPEGMIGGPLDMRIMLSAYNWLIQDSWHWPLLRLSRIDLPQGGNAGLMDVIPLVALPAKVMTAWFGTLNPYPEWVVACIGLNAAGLAAVVRGLGERTLIAAVSAAFLGSLLPVVHQRFGHLGLMAHWTFLFPMAAALAYASGRARLITAAPLIVAMCAAAFASTIYLYVMAAAFGASFFVQAALNRDISLTLCTAGIVGLVAEAALLFWAFGLGDTSIASTTVPFGYASMNLASPFWPVVSDVFGWTGLYVFTRGAIGATPGQYDASCYMGAGFLLLFAACAVRFRSSIRFAVDLARRNVALTLSVTVLAAWALSNKVYLGPFLIASYPLPASLQRSILSWFRFEGRFFWPVEWLLCALVLAGALRQRSTAGLIVVAFAIALQWIDGSSTRLRITQAIAGPPRSFLGGPAASSSLEAELKEYSAVRVVPAIHCAMQHVGVGAPEVFAGIELQLLASRRNLVMNSVLSARSAVDCAADAAEPLLSTTTRQLTLVLRQPDAFDRREEARHLLSCRPVELGLICGNAVAVR